MIAYYVLNIANIYEFTNKYDYYFNGKNLKKQNYFPIQKLPKI